MDDERGLIVFILVFLALVMVGFGIANQDQITPMVAEAQASGAIGTNTFMAVEKGASIMLKLLIGAMVAGVAAAAFSEVKSAYRAWKRSARMGRWQGGPNAKWQPKAPAEPKITLQDKILLALSGRLDANRLTSRPRVSKMRSDSTDDELDIEM